MEGCNKPDLPYCEECAKLWDDVCPACLAGREAEERRQLAARGVGGQSCLRDGVYIPEVNYKVSPCGGGNRRVRKQIEEDFGGGK